jgi:putative tryptophan/tyrosine transport system permease protein
MFETLLIILEQSLLHFPLILGAYISVSLMKLPDLSIESSYAFGALLATTALPYFTALPFPMNFVLVMCVSMFGGAIVGALSGMLTHKAGIPYLLSSIITIGIFHGIGQLIAGVYVSLSGRVNLLAFEYIPLHPELVILLVIGFVCAFIARYFFTTELGYSLAVFGDNPSFFSHYGISTTYVFMTGIMLAHACAGLSGYLCAQSNGFADISMGFGKLLLCITGLILGKIVPRHKISVMIPLCGLLLYFTLQQLLLKVGFDLRYFTMVQALVVVIILVVQHRQKENIHSDHLGV